MSENKNESSNGQGGNATYASLLHAVQTGVMYEMQLGFEKGQDLSPDTPVGRAVKHLRTGNNARACDHAALVGLLIRKGLITEEEYAEALLAEMATEKKRYEERLSQHYGANITLG
jgi:DNA-binding sugar fermentation-stimulating protein